MTNKIIYFSISDVLIDLYSVDNVFKKLDTFDIGPCVEAKPIDKYVNILNCLNKITNDDYGCYIVNAKGLWLDKYVGREYIDERIFIYIQRVNRHMYI